MRKRELVALLNLSSWCPVMVEWLFLAVPWGCLRSMIVVFPDHTHSQFFMLSWFPSWVYSLGSISMFSLGSLPMFIFLLVPWLGCNLVHCVFFLLVH